MYYNFLLRITSTYILFTTFPYYIISKYFHWALSINREEK